ncbi:hypothetical protein [Priestia megaterium]|uniref:hypothetical protein n=1 Tax=Priestia megaterium TaxID=1404 RepID=UPI0024697924|nr:hypothetical protein [Priestia megaterium]
MDQNYIESKNNIFNYLNNELNKLHEQKEKEINELLDRIDRLQCTVNEYKHKYDNLLHLFKEKEKNLLASRENIKLDLKQNNILLVDYFLENINSETIVDLFYFLEEKEGEEKAIFYQLSIIESLVENEYVSYVSTGLDMITDKIKSVNRVYESWMKSVYKILNKIYQDYSVNLAEIDDIYISTFKFAQVFADTPYYKDLSNFLENEAEFIISNSIDINNTQIINELLKTYFLYQLVEALDEILDYIIEEWEFIDTQLTLEQYSRILWYACYQGKDVEIVRKSNDSSNYLKDMAPEMKLYNLHNKLFNTQQVPNKEYFQLIDEINNFNNFEKVWIFEVLEEILKSNAIESKSKKEEEVVRDSREFEWPSIELTNSEKFEECDQTPNQLKEKSELRQLGYQITGVKRSKRWSILINEALPQLGLKKTAYTIAYLIRSRKKMKNGVIKNRYAIGEWEHDLSELKKHFYKNQFAWPRIEI